MIVHALQIISQELNAHLELLSPSNSEDNVELGNIAPLDKLQSEVSGGDKDKILITLINVREEKTLKNGAHYRRNDSTLKTEYFNPPVFLNLYLLISANQVNYTKALIYLSRIAGFFQTKNVFTHLNTVPVSSSIVPSGELMDSFKIIIDLYSCSFEELNHIWGTLGGKQVPAMIYVARLVEVAQKAPPRTGGLVKEVTLNAHNKKAVEQS